MGNIIDYVKEEMRKADEKPFSEVDSLVLCQFSYLPTARTAFNDQSV